MSHAVGSLISARGRDWVVLPDSDDELLMVRPIGGNDSETTGILLPLEGDDVAPAQFTLPNPSEVGDFRSSQLLRDALRLGFRSSAGPFRSFGRIAVTPRPYQLVPLLMALKLDPVRLLIADDVGIGKTIEALLVARELLDQGDVDRLAVLCSPQLAEQWQGELRDKFHLDAELVLPSTVTRLERPLGVGESLFEAYPFTVVSTDYIKSDRRRHEFLQAAPPLVIVDEAHTCVDAGGGRGTHQRHQLLRGLASDAARHLLLVTATPHSGKEEAFRSLLALLDPAFADLPDDLTGPDREADRRHVARHFVQRRRVDIRDYLNERTTFPRRESTEETYRLHPDYRRLVDRCWALARETVADTTGGAQRQRVRYWSVLALLRSVVSSPRAAAETLRNRARVAEADSTAKADEIGQQTVLDQGVDETADAMDVPPGSDPGEDDEGRLRRRLLDLARAAEALEGASDQKLRTAIEMVRRLLADGFAPILFCRFIPTAEYVAEALRDALGEAATVAAVTGVLPPDEREARIAELGSQPGHTVLVATDCLSEGINLQGYFQAVIHYDLSWNPTRHEQREGRVDRFGQPADVVRTVTYYGTDNRIDQLVLDVLLRKHKAIRDSLGISVPVPGDAGQVVEALVEGLLHGPDAEQLAFEELVAANQASLFDAWDDVADREKRSRTMFAQRSIDVEEVGREVRAVRDAIGSQPGTKAFVTEAARALGAHVAPHDDGVGLDFTDSPQQLRDRLGDDIRLTARFEPPIAEDEEYLSRTHPVVEQLAGHVLDTALVPHADGVATRCGAIRTAAVTTRTTLLLVRFRFHLVAVEETVERPLLAEDARILAFTGSPAQAAWIDADDADALFAAEPEANVGRDQAATFVQRIVDDWQHLAPHLDEQARDIADTLLDQHRRVRDAANRKGIRFRVEPHLPPDVVGVYVLLPTGA